MEGKRTVAAVFFGDGACNEGEFHEALNLASLWNLPLLFVCENNGYGVNTPAGDSLSAGKITRMPEAFQIASRTVDGNDVERVHAAAGAAIARLRSGDGPYFLECRTYRWHKHFLSDALLDLRPVEEIEAWKRKCPLLAYEKKLLKRGTLTQGKIRSMNARVLEKIEEAVGFAISSPFPAPKDALLDVYAQ